MTYMLRLWRRIAMANSNSKSSSTNLKWQHHQPVSYTIQVCILCTMYICACILCWFNVIAAVQFINRCILCVLCSMKLWRRNAFLLYARVTNCFCLVHISFPLSISILLLNVRVTNVWLNEKANAHRLTIAYRVATMNAISKWKSFKAIFYVCLNENEIFQKQKRLEDNLRHFKQRKKWSNFIFFVAPIDVSIDKLS